MEFDCVYKTNRKTERWKGRITFLYQNTDFYELSIQSRSSIHVIVGKTPNGGFACMPDFRAGCHLVNFRDIFWNTEKLVAVLGKVDGITVASALYSLPI